MRFPLLLLAWLAGTAGLLADLHVSLTGSDSNRGTRSKPFASLERARDAPRPEGGEKGAGG